MDKNPAINLFSGFPKINQKEWFIKITKDLKGRAIDELFWELEKGVQLNPFASFDTQKKIDFAIPNSKNDNDWDIIEEVIVNNYQSANTDILTALKAGANGIRLILPKSFKPLELSLVLKDVRLDFISLALSGIGFLKNIEKCIHHVVEIIEFNKWDINLCQGYLEFDPIEHKKAKSDWLELVVFIKKKLPAFIPITIHQHNSYPSTVEELAISIAKANECFLDLKEVLNNKNSSNIIQFSLSIGKSYFINIAKIRALKLLWANVLKANNQIPSAPKVIGRLVERSSSDDANISRIQLTTQAMSAVLGGVQSLSIAVNFENKNFNLSLARNLQHILKMETYFDRVVDPAAGSYYLEELTNILAENAWTLFQEVEAKGGYKKIGVIN